MKTVFVALVLLGTAVVAAVQPSAPQSVLQISPPEIGFPAWTFPGVQKDTVIHLTNPTASDITISAITLVELPNVPPFPVGWLGVAQTAPLVVTAGNTVNLTVQLNKDGRITANPASLSGKIILSYDPPVTGEDTIPIHFVVADSILDPFPDTVQTACLSLVVQSNGNMGYTGMAGNGGVNMNYAPPIECDTGTNSRGDAAIYLYDGSPVILRKSGTEIFASWSIFADGFASPNGFKPVAGFAPSYFESTANYEAFHSGTFVTSDSLIKVEKSWYAPKGMSDTCQFILQKMMVYPYTLGTSVPGLAIAEAIDWDVPSDSGLPFPGGYNRNVSGSVPSRNMVWLRGHNSSDTVMDCADNSLRYAGMAMLAQYMKNCAPVALHSGYTLRNDSFVYSTGTFVPSELWGRMQPLGFVNQAGTLDMHGVLVYRNAPDGNGWTLPANDTLAIWTALATTYQGGLSDLTLQIDKANKFLKSYRTQLGAFCIPCTCCQGNRGNVNMAGLVDLADLSLLIAYITAPGSGRPTLPCFDEADITADGVIDVRDISWLVGYLTIPLPGKPTLPPCPPC